MKLYLKNYSKFVLAGLFIVCSIFQSPAQCKTKNEAFKAGEFINYNLYFNWKFVWLKAGRASMITTASSWKSAPAYRMELLCCGNKRADRFFVMRDTLTSTISHNLEPLYYRKGSFEGKTYTVDEAYFTYKNGVSYVKQRRFKKGKTTDSAFSDSRCIYDMVSIMAYARSFDLDKVKVGERLYFPIATGKRVDIETLVYNGKKEIKADNDTTYRCGVFTLYENVKGEKSKEIITFYVTDDDNRLPIRLDLYLNFGSAKAILNSVRGYRHPFTSITAR